jgi:hypothetical protein
MTLFSKEVKTKIKRAWARLKKTDRLMLVGLVVVLVLAILALLVLPKFIYRPADEVEEEAPQDTISELRYRHPLTGAQILEPIEELPQVFGVMVDNHFDAWPASGIEEAFLVIEAPVEASIPRFIAFFSSEQEVVEIGPVRSARPYYLDWANEFDALYAHVGGSNAALDQIASGGMFDLNQYWWDDYFWRARDRYAPHNVFTSTRRLSEFVKSREVQGSAPERLYGSWAFKDSQPVEEGNSARVEFDAPTYVVDWKYDSVSGVYLREQAGEAHVASSGARMTANNVAVIVTDVRVLDNVGRRSVRTTGEGKAWVLQDGLAIDALWRKPSATERIKFYDSKTDEELKMNAGKTWIEVVGSEDEVAIE